MNFNSTTQLLQPYLPFIIVTIAFLFGWISEKIVYRRIVKLAKQKRWRIDTILIRAFHRFFILWSGILGVYVALNHIPIEPNLLDIFKKALLILFVLSLTLAFSRIASGLVAVYSEKVKDVLPTSSIFANLTKAIALLIGALIILQILGISITPILTALGIGGLAVALALQDTLSNLFSGLNIILSRQIRPGDYVRLDSGEEGYVTDITWRNTTIRELGNNRIIIPNSKLASYIFKNFHLPEKELSVLIPIGVSYDSDLDLVERVTIEEAKSLLREIQGGIQDFDPFIRYHTFGESSIDFSLILRAVEYTDQYLLKHECIKRLHKRYSKEGITIPFPIRSVYLEKGEG